MSHADGADGADAKCEASFRLIGVKGCLPVAARAGDLHPTYRKLADGQPRDMVSHGISDGCGRYL
jgi:hypothetical protein